MMDWFAARFRVADLLQVDWAVEQILMGMNRLPVEYISVEHTLNRVLAQDIRSEINLPPFANSSMDGYALRAEDVTSATRETPAQLRVVMDIPAGKAPEGTLQPGEAARIMTGAPLPDGANVVVPVESTDSQWESGAENPLDETVAIYRSVKPGDYVRPVGEDIQAGQIVLSAGTVLRPQDIGVLVGLGCSPVPVVRQPRIAIVSTGDELVGVNEALAPGKIRDSNSYTIAGLVETYGGIPIRIPTAKDTLDDVRRRFQEALQQQPDIIISSAGVSVGTFDMVRTVLNELGEVSFWRVNLRPGKPLAFGHLQGVPFFGLPGNPVSAMVTFEVFARPAILRLLGRNDEPEMATVVVGENIPSDGRLSYVRVRLKRENGNLTAYLTGTQSSGALMSMVLADGLLIIPEGVKEVTPGMTLPARLMRR
jgi:molybdopterin molybdotransferase